MSLDGRLGTELTPSSPSQSSALLLEAGSMSVRARQEVTTVGLESSASVAKSLHTCTDPSSEQNTQAIVCKNIQIVCKNT